MATKLEQVEQLIAELSDDDRAVLRERLAVRASAKPPVPAAEAKAAWDRFRELGRQLAAAPSNGRSLVDELSESRR